MTDNISTIYVVVAQSDHGKITISWAWAPWVSIQTNCYPSVSYFTDLKKNVRLYLTNSKSVAYFKASGALKQIAFKK